MKRVERVQAALYAVLICVFVGSGALFLSQYVTHALFWERFTLAYLCVLVVYTWYVFALLRVHDVRPRRYPQCARDKLLGCSSPCGTKLGHQDRDGAGMSSGRLG